MALVASSAFAVGFDTPRDESYIQSHDTCVCGYPRFFSRCVAGVLLACCGRRVGTMFNNYIMLLSYLKHLEYSRSKKLQYAAHTFLAFVLHIIRVTVKQIVGICSSVVSSQPILP